ncbi:hypothetical protein L6164_035955 [Bauhinia variegata]|uniref:Uncharacterized protein n=1 Tax=Bauhinia variegata TaxID=167791 RepID=A0ACB9KGD2_BAUVA|nr:hypothetical protein L6164_035955 [Bauhinia variegata]
MGILERLATTARTWRSISSFKTLTSYSACSRHIPRRLYHKSTFSTVSEFLSSRVPPEAPGPYSYYPAVLIGLFGIGLVETAYADANEIAAKPPPTSKSPSSSESLEGIAKKERERIGELLSRRGVRPTSCPRYTVAVKGQTISIKFQIPPACEIAPLVAYLVSRLGLKTKESNDGSDMLLRAWESSVSWQFTLSRLPKQKDIQGNDQSSTDKNTNDEDLCIFFSQSSVSSDKAEVEFIKTRSLSPEELDAFVSILQLAGARRIQERIPREGTEKVPSLEKSIASLESMGVRVHKVNEPSSGISDGEISWDNIAGYDHQKREIEDTILLALQNPKVYDDIAHGTRYKFESSRPRAVLFEGPPGTGKTSCARVIATQAGIPLLYVPLEVIMSKYYGESERLLGKVFSVANELPDGALIFLDEVDSFAVARNSEMHEATRRMLSVLLRQIDGFEQDKKVIVIAATNRKQDLDPALISRFDTMITFGLPDHRDRREIAAKYAKHLTQSELDEFAKVTADMSGRDIRDICLHAERSWASKIIRGQASSKDGEQKNLPPLPEYMESATSRRKALASATAGNWFTTSSKRRSQLDVV